MFQLQHPNIDENLLNKMFTKLSDAVSHAETIVTTTRSPSQKVIDIFDTRLKEVRISITKSDFTIYVEEERRKIFNTVCKWDPTLLATYYTNQLSDDEVKEWFSQMSLGQENESWVI